MPKTLYSCQHCGAQYPKWQGQCSECQKWNTIVEEAAPVASEKHRARAGFAGSQSQLTKISQVDLAKMSRLTTGLSEFDRVLGGGLVADSVVLIGGDPGIGKSTLLLQILVALKAQKPLYVTGEESLQQVAMRSHRLKLNADDLQLLAETNVERIIQVAEQAQPKVMVIDSIQTMYTEQVTSAPGGVSQVREAAAQLVRYAKQKGVALFIVGHVTKEGALAGPRVLEHMVDTVLYFEGATDARFRMIRATKNRFGAVNELGVFAMDDQGLKQVENPSAIFLSRSDMDIAGSVVMVTWEGTRPLLVEVQALVDSSHLPNPKRVVVGLDSSRLALLLAVLHQHAGIASYDQDVFANVVGGLKISETAIDLALVLAIVSSLRNQPVPKDMCVFGEVGLSGEIRPVANGQARLQEAAKRGFKRAIVPYANRPKQKIEGMEVIAIRSLGEAIRMEAVA